MRSEMSVSIGTTVTEKATQLSKIQLENSLGAALIVMGAIAVVPSALGVAQYKAERDPRTKDEGIFIVQAIILSVACVSVVIGIIILAIRSKAEPLAGSS